MTKLQPSQPYSEANKEFYAEWEKFFADGLFADGRRITPLDQDQGHCKVRDIATVRRDRTIAHCELFPELLVQQSDDRPPFPPVVRLAPPQPSA